MLSQSTRCKRWSSPPDDNESLQNAVGRGNKSQYPVPVESQPRCTYLSNKLPVLLQRLDQDFRNAGYARVPRTVSIPPELLVATPRKIALRAGVVHPIVWQLLMLLNPVVWCLTSLIWLAATCSKSVPLWDMAPFLMFFMAVIAMFEAWIWLSKIIQWRLVKYGVPVVGTITDKHMSGYRGLAPSPLPGSEQFIVRVIFRLPSGVEINEAVAVSQNFYTFVSAWDEEVVLYDAIAANRFQFYSECCCRVTH